MVVLGPDGASTLTPQRPNLVVAIVGDSSQHRSWVELPAGGEDRNWDLLTIYYGDAPDRFFCPDCVGVAGAQGPKWLLVRELLAAAAWPALAAHYAAAMFADDDLAMTAAVVSATFDALHARQLHAAQASVCAGGHSMYPMVFQDPRAALRFVPLVEIMAPALAMPFLQATVRPTLEGVCVGWGLDYAWPLLAGFPRDKFAIVDSVCMAHPAAERGSASLYARPNPCFEDAKAELEAISRRYGITSLALLLRGLPADLIRAQPYSYVPRGDPGGPAHPAGGAWQAWTLATGALELGAVALIWVVVVRAMSQHRQRVGGGGLAAPPPPSSIEAGGEGGGTPGRRRASFSHNFQFNE